MDMLDTRTVFKKLTSVGFSENQAKAILDIKLARLANLEIVKFEKNLNTN